MANFGHDWLRDNVGEALGWAEFALLASLSCDYLEHLGVEHAANRVSPRGRWPPRAPSLWMLLFCAADRLAERLAAAATVVLASIEEYLLFQART